MISRNLEKARSAYEGRNTEASRKAHDSGGEPHRAGGGQYIKSFVYGGLDGTITTFAVVAGVAGASLSSNVILILGFANLIADGIAMAFGDFLSTRAEQQYHASERRREEWELEHYPEGEKKELIEIYEEKGLSEEDASTLVGILEKHPEVMVDTMMVVELGILEEHESPLKNGMVTFAAFVLFGFIPLLVFVLMHFTGWQLNGMVWACVLTGATLFGLGVAKSRFSAGAWWRAGAEMLLLGGLAAVAAFFVGKALESLA
ncbi:MAG: VIT1/CCC1 transporter family protein [Verrucomicrobiales bacterium]|nr:VIT1/CCC1 transporter family protein [Verrucomicrobiales bacterium]